MSGVYLCYVVMYEVHAEVLDKRRGPRQMGTLAHHVAAVSRQLRRDWLM